MKNPSFYTPILALTSAVFFSAHAMEVSHRELIGAIRTKNLTSIQSVPLEEIEKAASGLCHASLQKTYQGRTFFHLPRYEKYLNAHSYLPWQALLFAANKKMIDAIEKRTKNLASIQSVPLDEIEKAASGLCHASLQKTDRGRTFFHVPFYEKYLNAHSDLPWQALFLANKKMIDAIENQQKTIYAKGVAFIEALPLKFIHLQRGIIYCETARELLKRQHENNSAPANIKAIQKMALDEYKKAYQSEPGEDRKAQHLALHRWNMCRCNIFQTRPFDRQQKNLL